MIQAVEINKNMKILVVILSLFFVLIFFLFTLEITLTDGSQKFVYKKRKSNHINYIWKTDSDASLKVLFFIAVLFFINIFLPPPLNNNLTGPLSNY